MHQGMAIDTISTCNAMAHAQYYLGQGYYWECHEVLEAVWMALVDHPVERQAVQGVIQIANGLLKVVMEQPKAATRLYSIAVDSIISSPQNALSAKSDVWSLPIWASNGLSADNVQQALDRLKSQI